MIQDYDDWWEDEDDENYDDFPVRTVSRQELSDAIRLFAWELSLIKEKELQNIFLLGKPSYLDVKKAYRLLAHAHHPDKGGDHQKIQKINEAFEILSSAIPSDGTEKEIESDSPMIRRPSKMEHPDVNIVVKMIKDFFRSSNNPNATKDLITLNPKFDYFNDLFGGFSKEGSIFNIYKDIYYFYHDSDATVAGLRRNDPSSYPHIKLRNLVSHLVVNCGEKNDRENLPKYESQEIADAIVGWAVSRKLLFVDEKERKEKWHYRKREEFKKKVEMIKKRHIFRKGISG